ncbi:hypothetical protein NLI96_g7408 [Meripilus lineatus]|uniref:F-box domain-containing protein n=1 Tax=Meripilus lineatus TaxID=2056292 RepID=A0AAD5V433_9APHY|nr:hypothetical protein NLI96_g7408 [Physisporinus lineatus]
MSPPTGPGDNTDIATIATLPIELLTEIFRLHLASYQHSRYPYQWIYITHVCRFWREIAIHQTPDLWTRIILFRETCLLTMLERSKNCLLSVDVWSLEWTPLVRHLVPHISRIRSLELKGPFVRYDEFRDHTPSSLERLCIIGYRYAFTDAIFCHTLRHLEIRGSSDFASLTHMNANIMAAFSKMVMLETVILQGATMLCPLDTQPVPPEYTVPLVHLKFLHLVEEPSACAFLLTHLTFPSSTNILLECGHYSGYHALSQVIMWKFIDSYEGDLAMFHTFIAENTDHKRIWSFSFCQWAVEIEGETPNPNPPSGKLTLRTSVSVLQSLPKACKSLPLDDTHTFVIRSCGIQAALALLGLDPLSADRVNDALFPQLETIVLDDVDFREDRWSPKRFEDFGQFLAERCKRRERAPSLILRRCKNVARDETPLVVAGVVKVIWQGA